MLLTLGSILAVARIGWLVIEAARRQQIWLAWVEVVGDHRNNSSDSRHWGMVPKKYIVGKVQLRWWPPSTLRVF